MISLWRRRRKTRSLSRKLPTSRQDFRKSRRNLEILTRNRNYCPFKITLMKCCIFYLYMATWGEKEKIRSTDQQVHPSKRFLSVFMAHILQSKSLEDFLRPPVTLSYPPSPILRCCLCVWRSDNRSWWWRFVYDEEPTWPIDCCNKTVLFYLPRSLCVLVVANAPCCSIKDSVRGGVAGWNP